MKWVAVTGDTNVALEWSRVILEKITVAPLVTEFYAFHGN
jgi:hypothetical protein